MTPEQVLEFLAQETDPVTALIIVALAYWGWRQSKGLAEVQEKRIEEHRAHTAELLSMVEMLGKLRETLERGR